LFLLSSIACILFKNTVFTIRGTDCGKRCNQRNKNIFCEHSLFSIGCFCKPGYFRNYAWDCVRGDQCDKEESKRLTTTTTRFPNKYSPNNPNQNQSKYTTQMLSKTTIKPSKQCGQHELFDDCGSFCIDSCTYLTHPNKCPMNRSVRIFKFFMI